MVNRIVFGILIAILCAVCGYFLAPPQVSPVVSTLGGLLFGVATIAAEWGMMRTSARRLAGAGVGIFLGVLCALFAALVLAQIPPASAGAVPFFQLLLLVVLAYLGASLGARKSENLNLKALGAMGSERDGAQPFKILDTSVIIDGRIADIADTGFLDGVLVIPQFVLRELQLVADSSDSMKRNRGRRGLDVLQRIQKMAHSTVRIVEEDFPQIREVDLKLIELAKLHDAKIVTNDFNLNKVAQLRGVDVLNINELANALKPIVLPGETMRVFILKEGKEYNQGVAYLDDGTMVVVDNAKRLISKTVDVVVTSVLQTTAGKMIFGKYDDRAQPISTDSRPRSKETAVGESSL